MIKTNIKDFINDEEMIIFLNKKRKLAIIANVISYTLLGIGVASGFTLILVGAIAFADFRQGLFIGLGFVLFLFGGLITLLGFNKSRKYKYYFETILLDKFASNYYDDFKFNFNGYIPKTELGEKEIFNRYASNMSECLYEGKIKNSEVSFKSSYYEYMGFDKFIVNKKGRIVIFKLNEKAKFNYLIENKKTKIMFKKNKFKEKVNVESIYFNDNYNIYLDDKIDAYKIFKPSLISGLFDFIDYYKAEINLLVKNNYVYVAINNYKTFDFSIMHRVDDDYIFKFRQEILMVYRLSRAVLE